MGRPIICNTVFQIKTNSEHEIIKYKVRFVATGYQQKYGIDYDEIFSPTLDATGLRTLLAFAIKYDYNISSANVGTAYLNAEIDKDVYMEQPEYMKVKHPNPKKRYICHLLKGIYGLKQSGRLWNKKITLLFEMLKLKILKSNNTIYTNKDRSIIVGIYVDDLIILSKSIEQAKQLINLLTNKCKLKMKFSESITDCLGMRVKYSKDTIIIYLLFFFYSNDFNRIRYRVGQN
jgi:hypothetical protein